MNECSLHRTASRRYSSFVSAAMHRPMTHLRRTTALVLSLLLIGCNASPISDQIVLVNESVEASCGQCQFGITEPPGCDLAIRTNGTVYFVEGAHIDDFGDAHAHDGFCQAIRTVTVSGSIEDGRFQATAFKLIPQAAP